MLPEEQSSAQDSHVEQACSKFFSPPCLCEKSNHLRPAFPAQHSSAVGLITLTPSVIYFTSVTALRPKLVIPRSQLRGVKKSSHLKGLVVSWVPADSEQPSEERFYWVESRDELFARLIGPDSRRWIRV